jgi:hypothetical protein
MSVRGYLCKAHGVKYLPFTFLFIVVFVLFSPFIGGQLLYSSDQVAAPAWRWFFDALRSGEFPLWNPYTLGGMPTWDASFGDAFYPPFLLLGFLTSPDRIPMWYFFLHTLVAGAGAYLLAKRHAPTLWALALGTAYMLNLNSISLINAGHTGKYAVICLLPWLFLAMPRIIPTAAVLTLMLLTSHLQMLYFVLGGSLLFSLFHRRATPFLIATGVALALTCFVWLPPIFYNQFNSVRGDAFHQSYEHAASWSLHWNDLKGMVWPEWEGLLENYPGPNPFKMNSEYPGMLILLLAGYGIWKRRTQGVYFWMGIAILATAFSLGANTPVHYLAYKFLPGMHNFRAPAMVMFWTVFALWMISAQTASRLPVKLAPFALALVLIDFIPRSHYFVKQTIPLYETDRATNYLQGQPGPFRVFAPDVPQGWGEYYGIETLNGFRDQEMKTFRSIRNSLTVGVQLAKDGTIFGSPYLDNLNVKWIVYRTPDGDLRLARYSSGKDRAWIDGGFAKLKARKFNSQTWEVQSPGDTMHLSEIFFPARKAYIDGKPSECFQVDNMITGVYVPAGRHIVTFSHESLWIHLGLWVSGAAMTLALLLTAYSYRLKFWPRMSSIAMFLVKHIR